MAQSRWPDFRFHYWHRQARPQDHHGVLSLEQDQTQKNPKERKGPAFQYKERPF